MKKLDWYIIRKFLGTFFYSIALLAIIIIIFDFSEKIDNFIEKKPSVYAIIFEYYANFLPFFINKFSALFTFISVIFFTSKLAANTEIIAMLNSGLSFNRLLRPYIIASTFLALISFTLTNFIIPETSEKMEDFQRKYLKERKYTTKTNMHIQIDPGVFAYVETFNSKDNRGFKFALEKFNNESMTMKLTSETINWDSINNKWVLNDWIRRVITDKGEKITRGTKFDTTLNLTPEDFNIDVDYAVYMNYRELRDFIETEKMRGSGNLMKFQVEKHSRIAFPFATIILTIIGVSLSSRKVRGGIGLNLGIGITISFTFILLMQITTVFSTFSNLPPSIGVWIPNIIFGLLGIYLLKIAPK